MNPHQNTPDYGKIPPQSRELEEIVLGAILLEKDAIDDTRPQVSFDLKLTCGLVS